MLAICCFATVTFGIAAYDETRPKRAIFPSEMVDLVPYEKNPVFTAAGPDHWDVKIRERG